MALPRGVLIVPLMVLTALVVAVTTQSAGRSAPPAQATMDPAHPCKQYPYPGGVVQNPPVAPNPHDITLYAFQDGQRYCYRQNTTDQYYYEAPTILVRNHDYFDITLHNRLNTPTPSGDGAHAAMSSGATPAPQGNPPCPVLDQMLPPHAMAPTSLTFTPPPERSPFPFSPVVTYLNHERSVDPNFPHPDAATGTTAPYPPPHLGDTNLHFHGLDTDPLEDNVFRSTNAAPNRTCKFHIPLYANQAAGTYWYHTHMHHISEGQVSGGLAGSLIVLPNLLGGNPNTPVTARNVGRVLLVKDLVPAGQTDEAREKDALLVRRANEAANAPAKPAKTAVFTPVPHVDPANPPPWYTPTGNNLEPGDALSKDCLGGGAPVPGATAQPAFQPMQVDGVPIYVTANANGRGTTQSLPEPNARHAAAHDERYRIIDASANAYLDVELFDVDGKTQKRTRKPLIVMARDGVDVSSSSAVHRSSVLIPPGGRLDIDVQDAKNDQVIVAAASHPQTTNPDGSVDGAFCPGNNGDYEPARDLLVVHPSSGDAANHVSAPAPHVASSNETTDADRLVEYALRLAPTANLKTSALAVARANKLLPHRVITFQQYWDGFYVTETSGDDAYHPKSDFVERPFELVKPPPGSHDTYVVPTIHVHRPKLKGPNDKYIEYLDAGERGDADPRLPHSSAHLRDAEQQRRSGPALRVRGHDAAAARDAVRQSQERHAEQHVRPTVRHGGVRLQRRQGHTVGAADQDRAADRLQQSPGGALGVPLPHAQPRGQGHDGDHPSRRRHLARRDRGLSAVT